MMGSNRSGPLLRLVEGESGSLWFSGGHFNRPVRTLVATRPAWLALTSPALKSRPVLTPLGNGGVQ